MEDKEFKDLEFGDVVRSKADGRAYAITGNYGERKTASRTVDLTNPSEWELVRKSKEP